ncbi:SusD/RagB family nutrient-binding outer membrane lipoprotein [Pontibacter sp. 172403-2]|uniref:SusD/RagB family nutrient-binding outer membrane lipoprotein n=1 Tax=Pontibacter rufus TaxID=2791028 RepID=UPI0018AFD73D|nr:SusD/RagB family nutrient-binding outer membrane lipoprotein [Pontibacter sp. 172403-2]MBF9251965.1 SusD/RagB family nutrient-binding outer membrane lipoprotein [Pontibacter sp. 172403-2]
MKKIRSYTLALILITGAMMSLQSCKDYFDLDENPNLVTNPPLNALLSTTTQKTALNSQRVAAVTSYFVQYLANPSAGSATDTYQVSDYTSIWDNLYLAMADIYDMKQKAQEEGASQYVGVADVLMAYNLSLVTDMFGDAPYSEAFNGSTLTPKFDTQEELYQETVRLLDEAIAELNKPDSKLTLDPDNDLIHGGSVENWIKTAYALKARFLNKISKTTAYNPQDVLAAVDQAYTSNADNAQMSVFAARNPWAAIALSNTQLVLGGWLSTQLVEHLDGTTYGVFDPRIAKITDKTVNGDYKGTPNGTGNVGPANNTVRDESYISQNSPLTGDLSPLVIISYAEVKFIEAEAAFRAGNLDRAYAAYLEGIRASMEQLEVAPAERDAYLSNPAVAVGAQNLTLDLIFKEKYIATYLNPEAWNDARRYDYQYANFTLPEGAALPTFIRRVAYPQGESSKNGANVPAVSSLADRLWWDVE